MSTKSKRRIARRATEQGTTTSPASIGPNSTHKIEGQIVGALLNAITFGAVDGPQSARAPQSSKQPADAPQTA